MAADPDRLEGLLKRPAAADLDDMVNAGAAGQILHRARPVRRLGIVDRPPRAHVPAPGQLVVAFRRDDRARARQDAELQREDGDAAGAEQQHRFPGLEAAADRESVPGGERRARQGRRLGKVQMSGDRHRSVSVKHDLLGQHAVDRSALGALHGGFRDGAGGPVLEEAAGNPVARGEAGDAFADRNHLARAVGIGDAREGQADPARCPHGIEIAVVDRIGPHPDRDLARPRLWGRPLGELQGVDAALVDDLPDFHGLPGLRWIVFE